MADVNDDAVVYIKVVTPDGVPKTQGSGVLVGTKGYILTARHVVDDVASGHAVAYVSLKSKNSLGVPAQIFDCGNGSVIDFCIIHIGKKDLLDANIKDHPALDCRDVKLLQKIEAKGYPSGTHNDLQTIPGEVIGDIGEDFAQASNLSIAPGLSGGPVFNENNAVVGVLIAVADQTSQAYFVPLNEVRGHLMGANLNCPAGGDDNTSAASPGSEKKTFKLDGVVVSDANGANADAISDVQVSVINGGTDDGKFILTYRFYNGSGSWAGLQKASLTFLNDDKQVIDTNEFTLDRSRCVYGTPETRTYSGQLKASLSSVTKVELSVNSIIGTQSRC